MGWNSGLVSALEKLVQENPEVTRALREHGITLEAGRVVGPQAVIIARLQTALQEVRRPEFQAGYREVEKIFLRGIKLLRDAPGSERPPAVTDAPVGGQPAGILPAPPSTEEEPAPAPALGPPPPPAPVATREWQDLPPGPWLPPELADSLEGFSGPREPAETCVDTLSSWRVLAGTRRGRLHAHHGTHREDAFAHGGDAARGFWVYCVCDGAGSSRLSRVGSEVTSQRLVQGLCRTFGETADTWAALPAADLKERLKETIVAGVRDVVASLGELAQKAGAEPKDFRCTLLLTVLYRHGGKELACLSQVGDGFLAGFNKQGVARRYGVPATAGDFSGEVRCFVPDENSPEQATPFGIMDSTENLAALLLCTDGIEDPFYPVETHAEALFGQLLGDAPPEVGPGSPPPLVTWAKTVSFPVACADPATACERLAGWLAFEKKGENDDRTLLLVHRRVPAERPAGNG